MMYDWSKELENMTLKETCIIQIDDAGEPVLKRVVQSGDDGFDTVVLTPICPHFFYQDITCVIVENGVPAVKNLLAELKWAPYTLCICLGKPCDEIKSNVDIWLEEGVSYDARQMDTYLDTFSLPKDAGFRPVTRVLMHFIQQLDGGFINLEISDIFGFKPETTLAYFSAGVAPKGSVFRAAIGASDALENHPPLHKLIAYYMVPADTDIAVIDMATKELHLIADPDGLIVFGAGFHQRPESMTYILGF
ncbi:hypothetical protein RFF05_13115 [Bengtsoniella intestinalis]|uniref:hypothetical protein n=1 Tax=Bengtsoniella intestinalis TaxID=3073143 RepID=UPI00391F6612